MRLHWLGVIYGHCGAEWQKRSLQAEKSVVLIAPLQLKSHSQLPSCSGKPNRNLAEEASVVLVCPLRFMSPSIVRTQISLVMQSSVITQ